MKDLEDICDHLDKLTLDTLTLMEEYIEFKLRLEDSMQEGETNLAKSRYILGQSSVSKLQLPSEDSSEFSASAVVNSENMADLGYRTFDIEFIHDKNEGDYKDPLRWFGVLVPQNMHLAQKKFKEALNWVGQIANVQSKLEYNCQKLEELRDIKRNLVRGIEE